MSDGGPKAGSSSCNACVSDFDCLPQGEACARTTNGAECLPSCQTNQDCAAAEECSFFTTVDGNSYQACVATNGSCGSPVASNDAGVNAHPLGDQDAGDQNNASDAGNQNTTPDAGNQNTTPDAGTNETPDSGTTATCPGYATPDETGGSCVCQTGHTCGANNCYGGYYCDLATNHCVAAPASCGTQQTDAGNTTTPDAGHTTTPDAGTTTTADAGSFTSSITASGGTESQLYFAVIGDTRPANGCDSSPSAYPTAIIDKIYEDIQGMSPMPPFIITTGDYQYVDQGGEGDPSCPSLAATQIGYYMAARAKYSGVLWPVMGNHECDGWTDSDCGSGCPATDPGCKGQSNTSNYLEFVSLMLQPIGESLPYYTRTVNASDGSWKATFIFTAPNYWKGTQQSSWVTQQISAAGTPSSSNYVFVMHHEDSTASSPPAGLASVEAAETGHETMSIVGHSHFWQWGTGGPYKETNARQLLVGNGGAPLVAGSNSATVNTSVYGYTTVTRQSDGSLMIVGYDQSSGQAVNTATVQP